MKHAIALLLGAILVGESALCATPDTSSPLIQVTRSSGVIKFEACTAAGETAQCQIIAELNSMQFTQLLMELETSRSESSFFQGSLLAVAMTGTTLGAGFLLKNIAKVGIKALVAGQALSTLSAAFGSWIVISRYFDRNSIVRDLRLVLDARFPETSTIILEPTNTRAWNQFQEFLARPR